VAPQERHARPRSIDDHQEQPVTEEVARERPAGAPPTDDVEEVAAAAEVGPTDDGPVDAAADPVDVAADPVDVAAEPAGDEPDYHPEEVAPDEVRSPAELLAELGEAEARRDEYLDDLRRARAEFENFRKRTLRESGAQREAGKADVLTSLLEVLDDLDRTLEAADASTDDALAKGVTLVAEKLVRSLRAAGLERVDETAVVFDPTVHEAVQQRPSDAPQDEPTVAEVLRPGYRLGDRVLRAAMVIVEQ
jgi:molecular chaperone GrpE